MIGLCIFACFGAISSWIAFGPGERQFSGTFMFGDAATTAAIGRIAFGTGAVIIWLCWAAFAAFGFRKLFDHDAPNAGGSSSYRTMRYPRQSIISPPFDVIANGTRACITMKYFAALMLALLSSSAVAAGSSQGYGMGGQFARFDPVVTEYNRSGELFRIESLFLGIRNVCIEPSAQLLFRAGHDRQLNITAKSTNHMLAAYKPKLRCQYLVSNNHMDTLAFHTIPGREMIDKFGYKACPK